mgnify:CR=1 FL=1
MPSYDLPLTLTETGFLPGGPLESMRTLNALINASWVQANTKQDDFEAKMAAATTGFLDETTAPHITAGSVTVPTITEPAVEIPAAVSAADIYDEFTTQYLELVALLADKFAAFRTSYFPNEQVAYTAAEDWLQAALANPNGGIPSAVLAQVWEDDRTRITADAARATADLLATFSSKRFPLPPGASAAAALEIQQKAQDEIAESSRKVAITSIENMKFAVTNLLNLRKAAMDSAVEYIKALASGPDMASRLVNVGYDAQSKLISSAASFYNARSQAADTISKVTQYNNTAALTASEKNQMSDLTLIEDKLKALLSEAAALAQMSTSLYNNLHANAGTGYSTSVTDQV